MKYWISTLCCIFLLMTATPARSIESASYKTLMQDGNFELRDYAAQIRVETEVEGEFKQAGNKAFRLLFDYISGDNKSQQKIAMTSPVSQETSQKVAMTTPVSQSQSDNGNWRVGFLVPAEYSQETVPLPNNPKVTLRAIPAQKMAAIRYSGTWSDENYQQQLQALQEWISRNGWEVGGDPTWARYDPPFKPWFLRRNEILIPLLELAD